MPYVPGFSNDIFISYAHGDDPAWIQAFEQALNRAIRGRLGYDISIWQDVKRLRVGCDWQNEIADGIARSAAFVAVLSPSYQTSDWCSRELARFLGPTASPDAVKAGDLSRFLKVVKIPWENNDHDAFFPRLQHVLFFQKVDGPQEYSEYPISSDAFLASLNEAAASVSAVLRTMRRQLQMVFVASPADDVLDAWDRVRQQLRDDRFDVRPDGRLGAGLEDRILLRDIEKAVLTVHLLGPAYDAFAERQLRLAADAGRRQLVWFAKGTEREDQVDPKQWKVLESVRKRQAPAGTLDWFPGTVQEMIAQVQAGLRPKTVAPAQDGGGAPRIYLLHDPTTRSDSAFAARLQTEIQAKEKLQVIFPPSGVNAASDFHERHRQQLLNSEGVLLYWHDAPETWLDQFVPDVLFPGRKARARSRAFLLDDPSQLGEAPVPIIRRSVDFQLNDLEPFLRPLRDAGANYAGA